MLRHWRSNVAGTVEEVHSREDCAVEYAEAVEADAED
jgi:hypothetical protein